MRGKKMKRTLQVFIITALMYSTAAGTALPGNVSTRVYLRDSNTPLELADPNVPWIYRDIMAGTQLKIIVDSNVDGDWSGGLLMPTEEVDLGYGDLYCIGPDCQGSILPDAGAESTVNLWPDPYGYVLFAGSEAIAGDWFAVDYNALSTGTCHVGLYDDNYSLDIPVYEMRFIQVPSRDFNGDSIVNFADFAFLGSYWGVSGCADPEGCGKVNLDGKGTIDIDDLGLFVDFWLKRTN
jgi:hypothetical protein